MLSSPLDNAILVYAVVASGLPPVPALSGPVPDALFFAQLNHFAQPGGREDMVETRNTEAVCSVRFPFGVYDDLKVRLDVFRCIGQGREPAVCRALVAV